MAMGFRSNFGPREEHEITCSKCSKKSTVPFKPTDGRDVFCQECFREQRQSRRHY